MQDERWRQVEALFHAAADLPVAEREAFLDHASGVDADLKQRVLELLAADDGPDVAGAVLGQAIDQVWRGGAVQAGSYRLLKQIGKGGMGAVYLAARADDQFEKQVAVKILSAGWDPRLAARFRQERQILARLEHPNIARLLDGGVTDSGQPFVAMEYVDGAPFTTWLQQNRVPLRRRLELFRDVCSAVHCAHRNLIIHRDLKPGNILVTKEGEIKLVDFGIAKILDDASGEALTREGELLLTPQYASPEQIAGRDITTAADIYSLGVILFELLTDRRPFDQDSVQALAHKVLVAEPPRPSRAAPEPLRRVLEGDLDTIALKALQKEPVDRYLSAEQLSEDVRRYLHDLPIQASPDAWTYHLRKFTRRHRLAVSAFCVLMTLIVALSVLLVFKAAEARRERDAALAERDKSRAPSAFLTGVFESADPEHSRGRDITARELLDRGAQRMQVELKSKPEVRAPLLDAIARAFRGLGLYDRAAELAEESVSLRESQAPAELSDGLALLSTVRARQGRFEEAENLARRAVSVIGTPTVEAELALDKALLKQGKYDEALQAVQRAWTALQKKGESETPLAASVELDWGETLLAKRDHPGAEQRFRRALAIFEKSYGRQHDRTAKAMARIADILRLTDRKEETLALRKEVLAIDRAVLGDHHPEVTYALDNLAAAYLDNHQWREAQPYVEELLKIRLEMLGPKHVMVAQSYQKLAWLYSEKGDHRASEAALTQSIQLLRELYGDTHPEVLEGYRARAINQYAAQDWPGMERDARKTIEIAERLKHPAAIDGKVMLFSALFLQNKLPAAEETAREIVDHYKDPAQGDGRRVIDSRFYLGHILVARQKSEEAITVLEEAARVLREKQPKAERRLATIQNALAAAYEATGQRAKAATLFRASTPVILRYRSSWSPGDFQLFERRYKAFEVPAP